MEQLTNNSIIWAAGENSGDYLASRVLPAVAASRPNLKMEGIGGDRMIQDGLDPWFHASELSVRGYLEVIRHLPRILKIRREMMRRTIQFRPAAYILYSGRSHGGSSRLGLASAENSPNQTCGGSFAFDFPF